MSSTRVRRRALACARCRVRKVKCDGLSPSCSRCYEAGVPCVALDPSTKRPAPRSIVQCLENEIAQLESHKQVNPRSYSSDHPSLSLIDLVIKDFTPSFLGVSETVPLVRCAVAGTRVPSTRQFASDIDEHHPRSILNPLPSGTPLESIPTKVADFLFENYTSRVLAQYPLFYKANLVSFFNSIFHNSSQGLSTGAQATAYEIYVVSLVMAISLSTAARTQQARANAIAVELFKTAMQQIPSILSNDLEGLQALLLLLQYTFLDPGAANLWFLSGFTSQACLDLGLHQELPESSDVTPLLRDMRRRIFWCAYEMEVAVCAALLRPTSMLSKYINVSFPTEIDDSAISETGIDPTGRFSKVTARRIWLFRKIESEIVSVLFQNEELPPGNTSLETWIAQNEAAILEWNQEVHRSTVSNKDPSLNSTWTEMSLYADIAYHYIIVTLFRPCPRIPHPTPDSLMKAFRAGVEVADGYWKQANLDFGSSKYVFHPCHHSFSSAVAFLQALQRCKIQVSNIYTLDQVESFMSCFSRLFTTISERWPAASRCLEEYERLLAPVKKEYVDFLVQQARDLPQQHSPDLGMLVGFAENLIDPAMDLDEMFNFGSLFRPAGTVATDKFQYTVPADWNAEFDFGMT